MTDNWTLEDFISRIELHPEFEEVYVEGESDIVIYSWFLEQVGRKDILTYPISSVSVPYDVQWGFDPETMDRDSRRSEVIILASTIESQLPSACERITCIADADTHFILPQNRLSRALLYTDYTSVEMYAYRPDLISKMVRLASPRLKPDGDEILQSLTPILETLFCIRATNYSLRWGLNWVSPEKQCSLKEKKIVFDEATFLRKYLGTRGKQKYEPEFRAAMKQTIQSFGSDPRKQIRGHDFIQLLLWYLRERSKRQYQSLTEEAIKHSLFCQLAPDDLGRETLFLELCRRYPAESAR